MKFPKRKLKLVIPLLLICTTFLVVSTVSDMSLSDRPVGALPEDQENSIKEIMYRPVGAIPERINEGLGLLFDFLGL